MFYSIRGRLIFKSESFVVIECAGVGYRCYTSQNTMNKIGSINSQAVLYTQLVVREDAMELYGFYNIRELELFKLLCTVSGVGAKMIRGIMKKKGISSLEELISDAISHGVNVVACQMSMDIMGIHQEELIDGVSLGGVSTFLGSGEKSDMSLFI